MFFKEKTILLSDFDYTLFEHDNQDSFASNLEAIKEWRRHGNLFAITTGRSKASLQAIFPDYKDYADYCVLCDGSLVVDRHDKIVFDDIFKTELANNLNAALNQIKYTGEHAIICFNGTEETQEINSCTGKIRFWFSQLEDSVAVEKLLEEQFADSLDFIAYHDAAFNDDTRLPWIGENLHYIIEVNRKGINKKAGIDKLLDATNLRKTANIVVIGDGKNDICMIRAFNGYAMKNASKELFEKIPNVKVVPHLYDLISTKLSLA